VTSTVVPLVPAGAVAVMELAELTMKFVAAVDPKLTAVAPVNPEPVIATDVPPVGVPETGLTAETDAGPSSQVSLSPDHSREFRKAA
jgi:hypothetical protein